MNLLPITRGAVLSAMIISLTACSMNPVALYKNTNQNINKVQAQVTALESRGYHRMPSLNYTSTSAALPPARWLSQPNWMNQSINIHGKNMPFSFWVNKILSPTGANISYEEGMNANLLLPLDYTGTVRGALDRLAAATGYSYTVDGARVNWVEFATQTFDVSFMPGAAQYMMGGQTNIGNASNNSGGAAGSGGASGSSAQLQGNQYSSMQGNLSVWADLESTIKTMLSKEGQVMVSQATTTITVRDKPENVRVIADYLASMNKDLSRQVALQVQVLQIRLDKAFSYGINWNLVTRRLSVSGGITDAASGATALGGDLVGVGGLSATGIGFNMNSNGNPQALINALSQQGQVSTVTNPRVITLNNQVAQIAITTQKTYLASSTLSQSANANTGNTVTLTPGEVTTGFTLYVLPKITNHDVYLQLTSELSSLDSMTKFEGNSGGASTSKDSSQPVASIEEPTVSSKSFNQRAMVPSGATLVLSGYRQVSNESNKSAPFAIDPLGSRGVQQDTIEILVLITPVIVGDNG
jgi:type IVB pilus formation R64 PilN family outer membrane protein